MVGDSEGFRTADNAARLPDLDIESCVAEDGVGRLRLAQELAASARTSITRHRGGRGRYNRTCVTMQIEDAYDTTIYALQCCCACRGRHW